MEKHLSHIEHNHLKQGDYTDHPSSDAHRTGHASEHGAHHVDHTGHELMFRNRFWVCLVLSIPVLLYSPMLQSWLGFSMPAFPGSTPV